MPTPVTLYRLFVASPGDCREERQQIRDVVSDWNIAYGHAREIYLEPVLWETHARPELGDRPQAIINRQLLDTCDALIAVFRTRLGTPTLVAESGTVEEIRLFQQARKPVLLYFHRSLPSEDLDRFRVAVSEQGLVWSYDGLWEFTRDVARHIALAMAELVGTPKLQATFANELTDFPPRESAAIDIPSQLLEIRAHTRYLWEKLESLSPQEAEFTCSVKQSTFGRVRGSLDRLALAGHLKFKTEFTHSTADDAELLLSITVSAITQAFRQAVHDIVRERGIKHFSSLFG